MNIEAEVKRQMEILKRGVEEIISEEELEKKLKKSLETGEALKIKLGIDPTGSDLHIGMLCLLENLNSFKILGTRLSF